MAETPWTNRLAGESSPYLLQHAHNPVDWFPWGPEALRKAREEDRPILLSVGYSACHWCHVMERESFEDAETARVMNAHFVSIKVDREERPDLDHIYQTAIQVLGKNGGWPLTMFLTPALKPFFGGTYFPPVDRYGMRSFRYILESVARAYREQRDQVDRQAAEITEYVDEVDRQGITGGSGALSAQVVTDAAASLLSRFDLDHGGFGDRPKFPNSTALELWLRTKNDAHGERVIFGLTQMIDGGIFDQLGGGFHRYSTDERWLVPHFEKMLYDNGLLLRLMAQAWQSSRDARIERAMRLTADYVLREMTDSGGGFYSTQDADSEGEEGKFFVWDEDEVRAVVAPEDVEVALRMFGVVEGGNFEHGKSVLHRPYDSIVGGKLLGMPATEVETRLERARVRMLEAREKRIHPHRDDKILAGWNGLMMHGLALAGSALGESRYIDAAVRCSDFVATQLVRDGTLLRTMRAGQAKISAFAEDYAFLSEGELALFEATGDPKHLTRARGLVDTALGRFADPAGGFFVTPADGEALIQRPRASYDNAVPSATSSLTHALVRLHALTGEGRYADAADRTLRSLQDAMAKNPFGYTYLLCALEAVTSGVGTLVVTGTPGDPRREALLRAAQTTCLPNVMIVPGAAVESTPALASLMMGKSNEPAAYLCRHGTCSAPVREPSELSKLVA